MRLYEYLTYAGTSQTELAKALGVSQSYVSEILATEKLGSRLRPRRPSPELAIRIVEVTNGMVSLDEALFPNRVPSAAPGPHVKMVVRS